MNFTRSELVGLLRTAGNMGDLPPSVLKGQWPDYGLFAEIALRGSGGDPLYNHVSAEYSVDRGLWQINSVHEKELLALFPEARVDFRTACYTPLINALFAVVVFQKQGYKAWVSFAMLP